MWDNGGECMLSACDKNSLFILACCKGVCFALYALAVVISAFGFACIYSWVCVHLFLGLRAFILGFACICSWVCVHLFLGLRAFILGFACRILSNATKCICLSGAPISMANCRLTMNCLLRSGYAEDPVEMVLVC